MQSKGGGKSKNKLRLLKKTSPYTWLSRAPYRAIFTILLLYFALMVFRQRGAAPTHPTNQTNFNKPLNSVETKRSLNEPCKSAMATALSHSDVTGTSGILKAAVISYNVYIACLYSGSIQDRADERRATLPAKRSRDWLIEDLQLKNFSEIKLSEYIL